MKWQETIAAMPRLTPSQVVALNHILDRRLAPLVFDIPAVDEALFEIQNDLEALLQPVVTVVRAAVHAAPEAVPAEVLSQPIVTVARTMPAVQPQAVPVTALSAPAVPLVRAVARTPPVFGPLRIVK